MYKRITEEKDDHGQGKQAVVQGQTPPAERQRNQGRQHTKNIQQIADIWTIQRKTDRQVGKSTPHTDPGPAELPPPLYRFLNLIKKRIAPGQRQVQHIRKQPQRRKQRGQRHIEQQSPVGTQFVPIQPETPGQQNEKRHNQYTTSPPRRRSQRRTDSRQPPARHI